MLSRVLYSGDRMTVMLRCLGCGFSFTVTYPQAGQVEASTMPVACGHCRGTRWASQAASA
jgi:hypothetical protein